MRTARVRERDKKKKPTFLYVVSPEASTLLWPIFFSWATPAPNGDGICHRETRMENTNKCEIYGSVLSLTWIYDKYFFFHKERTQGEIEKGERGRDGERDRELYRVKTLTSVM